MSSSRSPFAAASAWSSRTRTCSCSTPASSMRSPSDRCSSAGPERRFASGWRRRSTPWESLHLKDRPPHRLSGGEKKRVAHCLRPGSRPRGALAGRTHRDPRSEKPEPDHRPAFRVERRRQDGRDGHSRSGRRRGHRRHLLRLPERPCRRAGLARVRAWRHPVAGANGPAARSPARSPLRRGALASPPAPRTPDLRPRQPSILVLSWMRMSELSRIGVAIATDLLGQV